jgi:hypothetical protein
MPRRAEKPRGSAAFILAAALLLWLPRGARAEDAAQATNSAAFRVGEELLYDIHWGIIPVAKARATTEWVEHEGRKVIRIRYVTKTLGVVEAFYPVDDLLESLVDPATFLPIRFVKKLSEGGYRADEETTFDFARGKAQWKSNKNKKTKEFDIEADTRDVVSFMYHMRTMELTPGTQTLHRLMADEKLYDLKLKMGAVEDVKLSKYGSIPSVKVEPEASFQGLFVRKGKMTCWVSRDPRRICTRITASVPVASIRITLEEVKGPGDDFWVKPKKGEEDRETGP